MDILGHKYKLDFSKDVDQIQGGAYGEFNQRNNVILIANDILIGEQTSTLLHEIFEAINYYLELDLNHNEITCLESGLFQVLTANGVDLSPLLSDKELLK